MNSGEKGGDGYHHGDLRAALLRTAVELIAEHGPAKLSLRECARRAGVSHAAPYRHFADKDALLAAIATEGFEWLHQAALTAMEGRDDPRDRLDAYGIAYVRFAVEHPVHVKVMFSLAFEKTPSEVGEAAFQLLLDTAAEAVGAGADPMLAAVAAWSLPHGLSMLILDGRIPSEHVADPQAAEDMARSVFAMWRRGLRR